jgi:hypothetical protein
MKGFLIGLAVSLFATSAVAQARPSSVAMSCRQAAGLVASHGAIVLGTGGYTYDRFVADQRFCLRSEVTVPAWVPSGDTPQCFVGYRCKEAERFDR